MTRIRLNGVVPDPQSISPADKQLFLEFAVQGNHLRIQEMNSGSPGFKVDRIILESYIERPEDLEYLRGLSEAALPEALANLPSDSLLNFPLNKLAKC